MAKPPNIFVYSCRNHSLFDSTCKLLDRLINKEKYIIYQLQESEQWQKHCQLLVINTSPHDIPRNIMTQLKIYSDGGGKMVCLGGYFTSLIPWDSYIEPPGPCLDEVVGNPYQLAIGQGIKNQIILLGQKEVETNLSGALDTLGISLKSDTETKLTPLYCCSKSSSILKAFFQSLSKNGLHNEALDSYSLPCGDNRVVPVVRAPQDSLPLQLTNFPDVFIRSKVVSSTQKLLWDNTLLASPKLSVAILADRQVDGIGRGSNQWISPLGSLSLSCHCSFSSTSPLGSKLPFIQYLMGVAAIESLKSLTSPSLPVGLKWPNDIYTTNGTKIGGILVNCSVKGTSIMCCVGIGINLNNSEPTVSVAGLSGQKSLDTSEVACVFLDAFKREMDMFNSKGVEAFVERYKEAWIHGNETKVKVQVEGHDCEAVIVGIDKDGFLLVQNITSGKFFSVQPDGNSFDMLSNLIAVKARK